MNQAVLKMCDDWGVPEENVAFDDFEANHIKIKKTRFIVGLFFSFKMKN